MTFRSIPIVSGALFVLLAAGCGSDSASAPTTSEPVVTIDSSTSSPTSTTSVLVTTTATPTTVPAGWSTIDPGSVSPYAVPPCCGETWRGDVSPALPPEGQPLADGAYAVTAQWAEDPAMPLVLEVFRFEQCSLLPEFACEPQGVPFEPTQLGVDSSASLSLTVALDDTTRAVVVGWDDGSSGDQFVIQQAAGSDLAILATAVEESYATVFAQPFLAGRDRSEIIAEVLANPRGGFGPARSTIDSFVFTPASGPPLLFQIVLRDAEGQPAPGRGTDVLAIRSIEVIDGRVTLHVYSAYYP